MKSVIKITSTVLALSVATAYAADTPKDNKKSERAEVPSILPPPPPPPPVLDKNYEKQLKASAKLSTSDKKLRAENQKQRDEILTPLTLEEIRRTKEKALEAEKITNFRGAPNSMAPRDIPWSIGSNAPVLRMAPGYTTTVLFFDASGQPLPIAQAGAITGDQESIDANSTGNAVVLYVKKPWRSTNLTVFLTGVPVPVQMTLTSERDATNMELDYQVRVRVSNNISGSANIKDTYNMDALMKMTNGLGGQTSLSPLPIKNIEKGDPSQLNWVPVSGNIGEFRIGGDGLTYVLLKSGFKLLYPAGPVVLATQTGPDGSQGYIVGGNNPRVFTAQDSNGATYRITLQR